MEHIWHRTMSDSHRTRPNSQVYTYNRLMSFKAKSDYYTKSVTPKQFPQIYGITKQPITVLHKQKSSNLPPSTDTSTLSNSSDTFLKDKIAKIRVVFQWLKQSQFTRQCQTLTEEDVRKLLSKSPAKLCDLDPGPTFIIKECLDVLLIFVTLENQDYTAIFCSLTCQRRLT